MLTYSAIVPHVCLLFQNDWSDRTFSLSPTQSQNHALPTNISVLILRLDHQFWFPLTLGFSSGRWNYLSPSERVQSHWKCLNVNCFAPRKIYLRTRSLGEVQPLLICKNYTSSPESLMPIRVCLCLQGLAWFDLDYAWYLKMLRKLYIKSKLWISCKTCFHQSFH